MGRTEQVDALRASRDQWIEAAICAQDEKVAVECEGLDYIRDFVNLVATIIASGDRTPEELAALERFLMPPPPPAGCPPPWTSR